MQQRASLCVDFCHILHRMNTKIATVLLIVMATASGFGQQAQNPFPQTAARLAASSKGRLKAAFVISEGAVMIDFAGPWEVFQDVMVEGRGPKMEDLHVFDLYTVSDSRKPIRVSDGMQIVPDYTFEDAPKPDIVVVPAQGGHSTQMLDWLRQMAKQSDVVMSVCNGAFKLADAGLLDGKMATAHHSAYGYFQKTYPKVMVQRNVRYVQSDPVVFTAGGLSSGIDLALHIVELAFGRDVAEQTAMDMEYEGHGWKGDGKSSVAYWIGKPASNPSDKYGSGVFGNWQGKLVTADVSAQVAVHLWPDKSGNPMGTVDSIDEDMYGMAVEKLTFAKPNIAFGVAMTGGEFSGKLNAQETEIAGTWMQNGKSVPLLLERASK